MPIRLDSRAKDFAVKFEAFLATKRESAADVEELAARIPTRRTLTFADAGHLIPTERPRPFADALLDFARTLRID